MQIVMIYKKKKKKKKDFIKMGRQMTSHLIECVNGLNLTIQDF